MAMYSQKKLCTQARNSRLATIKGWPMRYALLSTAIFVLHLATGIALATLAGNQPANAFDLNEFIAGSQPVSVTKITDAPESGALKILFVGNSFTYVNSLPSIFANLVELGQQRTTQVWQICGPGLTFKQQIDKRTAVETASKSGPWDYVILQGATWEIYGKPEDAIPAGIALANAIRNTRSRVVIFENWADPGPYEAKVHDKIRETTVAIATRSGIAMIPIGDAWYEISQQKAGTKYNINLYNPDEHHPSKQGAFLNACLLHAYFLGRQADLSATLKARPDFFSKFGIAQDKAQILNNLAWAYYVKHHK